MRRARGFKEITPIGGSQMVGKVQDPVGQVNPNKDVSVTVENSNQEITQDKVFPPSGPPPLNTIQSSIPNHSVDTNSLIDLNPFPYLFKSKYDFKFDQIKDKILKDINRSKEVVQQTGLVTPERDGGYTTVVLSGAEIEGQRWVPPHMWPELDNFINDWLPDKIKTIWSSWHLSKSGCPFISESWVNEHQTGAFTEEHHHHNAQIAISCYLDVPPNSGRLMIKDPMSIYNYSRPMRYDYEVLGLEWRYIDVEANDVLFFPGFLRHETERSQSQENRYILSINIRDMELQASMGFNAGVHKPLWKPGEF